MRKARRRIHGRRCDFSAYFDLDQQEYRFLSEKFVGIDTGFRKRGSGGASESKPRETVLDEPKNGGGLL